MKIAILHPVKSTNLGDRIILSGVRELLKTAFGSYDELIYDLGNAEASDSYIESLEKNIDLFVLSGTPWLWDKCHQSRKYAVLQKILSFIHSRKVALGIGSCFPLASNIFSVYLFQKDANGHWEITRQHTREKLKEIFSQFDYVGTRDRLAFHILRAVGVNAFDSICPAAHVKFPLDLKISRSVKPLLVFLNPWDGVSRESCDDVFLSDFIQFQKWFKETYNPEVITMDSLDFDWCRGQNWDVEWVKTEKGLAHAIASASFVVSGRVHAAIPASVWGKRAFILPWDSRYLTAQRVGVAPILTFSDRDWDMYDFHAWTGIKEITKIKLRLKEDKDFVVDKLKSLF